jgi:subtilisin
MKKKSLTLVVLVLALLGLTKAAFAQADGEERVIIGFKDETGQQAAEKHRAWVYESGGKVRHSYRFLPGVAARLTKKQILRLKTDSRVAYVEADSKVYALDAELDNSWGVKHIGAGNVHSYNKGTGVKVAVIDTGIDYDHPDLSANYYGGHDFVNDDVDPMDDNGHGTHCAGIVAALDNGIGVIGVAPEAHLYAIKVLDSGGSGYLSDVVAGIEWAIENHVQIISMSFGSNSQSQAMQDACNKAYNDGLLLVAAAGNDYSSWGGWWEMDTVDYPARYDTIIAVGATDKNNNKASWSSTGPTLELASPGVSIYSTYWNNSYKTISGTSMACPHVAGVAALVWAGEPGLSNAQVRTRLRETAIDLGSAGRDQWYGYGLVDADGAVPGQSNNIPVAHNDNNVITPEDTAVIINVLANDTDADNEPLTVTNLTQHS